MFRNRSIASSVPAPIPTQTKPSNAAWTASRRARSDHGRGRIRRIALLMRRFENIPGATQRMDHGFAPCVYLLP
ncbi:Uncharacterised protein [Mycobacteroides abscessus subsp. abscessus]|nr:Uncharacterised protein [Mycobacteroides abscessus subsp. abscessus]